MASAPATIDNAVKPVAGKIRIQALDVIRGLSILGILAVNADGYAAPQAASLHPQAWLYPNEGATALSYWVMDTFFHDKFLTLFSMLFGVSLFLVGGERSDKRRGEILARRLVVLFGFAMLHGFGIWWGDILSLYAVTGCLMFFCRSWRPKTLLTVGISLYAAMMVRQLPPELLSFSAPTATQISAQHHPDPSALRKHKVAVADTMAEAKGSWSGAYRVNAQAYRSLLQGDPWLIPQTLGLMMIGLALFKQGYLAGRSSNRRYALAIAAGLPGLIIVGWLCWRADVLDARSPVTGAALLSLAPFVALAYAAGLMLLLRTSMAPAMKPLAAAGRMAFTNYLSQSIIMTTIFYGGRGALMGEVDRPGLWVITLAIWTLQLVWSPLWLSRFEMGPFEWVWRMLTIGRIIPLRKPA